jgi:AbrB family looped-hinge helix DNA binding protein
MPDMLTVSTKGQITLPVDLRVKYGLSAGDKLFAEETEIGYVIKRPKKNLLDYKGFIKDAQYDPATALASAIEGATVHIMGDDEC